MDKTLIIGDCHFQNLYPSLNYLQKQFHTIYQILEIEKPRNIIFLGDIFHFRKPDPETVIEVYRFFSKLGISLPGLSTIYLMRGNHDTASKTDEAIVTMLNIFDSKHTWSKIKVIERPVSYMFGENCFNFIPHYDDENIILSHLQNIVTHHKNTFVFGHFGFKGCLNPNGDEDCPLTLDVFKYPTFLGHIHKKQDEGNVHVVGTPYSTSFSEADNQHRYGIIYKNGTYEFKPITFGIRYLQFDLHSLEANKDFINDPKNYSTILRVYLNQILDINSVDLRKKIMLEYNVKYVDIKYLPMFDDDTIHSSYSPNNMVFEVTDEIINNYLAEAKTEISKELLLEGLSLLKDDQ
jgi:DNA repair exonuclease SbcCD nuclease subunit